MIASYGHSVADTNFHHIFLFSFLLLGILFILRNCDVSIYIPGNFQDLQDKKSEVYSTITC